MGKVYAPWFQALNTFNPLSLYSSPLSPLESLKPQDSPQHTPPPSPPAQGTQARKELAEILAYTRKRE